MVKNLDNASKFLMYPRFVQVFLEKQLEGMQSHKRIYVTPSHTKKIFGNIRRVGKGFFGRDTPLFPIMMIQAQQEQDEDNVVDEALNEELDDSLVRAATTATGLDAEQDSGNIDKTQSKATPNEPSSQGTRVNTPQSDEDRLKLNDLIEFYTKLQQRVLDLENTKTAQDLKSKSFANIQELFDKAMKRVNTFVDYRTELVEGSSKKADAEIAQESSSKRARDELE
ncbi:hypothetical protein Tco_1326365 [Tanacetum coccineum]